MISRIVLSRQARNYFARLPRDLAVRVNATLMSLKSDPLPPGSKPLKGHLEGFYRLRIAHTRAIYEIREDLGQIRVLEIGTRGEMY